MQGTVLLRRDIAALEKASRKIGRDLKSLRASLEQELKRAAKKRVKIVEAYNRNP